MDARTKAQYEREFFRRLEKYKNPRKATQQEVEQRIERFRKIGTPVFLQAADKMEKAFFDNAEV